MKKYFVIVLAVFALQGNVFSQWTRTQGPDVQAIYSLLCTNSNVYAGTSNGVFLTTNEGANWIVRNIGITGTPMVHALASYGSKIIAGTDSGIYVSSNNALTWIARNSGIPYGYARKINSLFVTGDRIFAGTDLGIFLSVDGCDSWTEKNAGLGSYLVLSFVQKENNIFAGTGRRIFKSSNYGDSWDSATTGIPLTSSVQALATDGNYLAAAMCCGAGIYISGDNGTRWEKISQEILGNTFSSYQTRIFVGSVDGILVSTNGGQFWVEYNEGLQFRNTTAIAYNSTKIFAAIDNFVWKRPLGELIGIAPVSTNIPDGFMLYQNYPNPFNPTTNIKFQVQKSNGVKLVIFDALGKEIAILVNEHLQAGPYEVTWDASEFPSGIYFYQLQTINYKAVKKMVLLK